MHAWFAAAADVRYAVVAPVIGVQVTLNNLMKPLLTRCSYQTTI